MNDVSQAYCVVLTHVASRYDAAAGSRALTRQHCSVLVRSYPCTKGFHNTVGAGRGGEDDGRTRQRLSPEEVELARGRREGRRVAGCGGGAGAEGGQVGPRRQRLGRHGRVEGEEVAQGRCRAAAARYQCSQRRAVGQGKQ